MAATRFGILARQLSTTASRPQLVKAPIQLFGITGRYAHALFSAATKEKNLDVVEKELKNVQGLLQRQPLLNDFIHNPSVKRKEKQTVLLEVLANQKVSPTTSNLFGALAENGRLNYTDGVIAAFGQIMSAHRGEVSCTVTTAKPLDAANLKQLEAALKSFMKKGEVLFLSAKVDPSLVGGMVVTIGDKYVDMSMATKIKTYTNLLQQAV